MKFKNLICKLFGHKPPSYSDTLGGDYSQIELNGEDGIGRHHCSIYGECPRCGKRYQVCKAHVPIIKE